VNQHETESITGLLDGELTGLRRWRTVGHVRVCPMCATEYRRQRHVRRLLQANPPAAQMSDSPEFFWSKVKAQIQRGDEEPVKVLTPRLGLPDWLWHYRFAMATAAVVAVAALGMIGLLRGPSRLPGDTVSVARPVSFTKVEQLSTVIPDTVATAFDSEDAQVTVIWVSGLPWTSDMDEMKTAFANLDT
jgi:anti-sigma factor RsiW